MEPADITALSKPDRARELSSGRVLLYLYKKELKPEESQALSGLIAQAGAYFRVLVAKSPLPDRGQVRIGPALIIYEEGVLRAVRPGELESKAMLDRWLRSVKRVPAPPAPKEAAP